MKVVVLFILTFYFLYHHVSANQQSDDPTKPFWASRGRRSGRLSIKADDDIPEKWSEDYGMPEVLLEKDIRTKQQATSFLANLLNTIYSWNGDVVRKRGDPKNSDPSNPFWAARG